MIFLNIFFFQTIETSCDLFKITYHEIDQLLLMVLYSTIKEQIAA